MICSTSAVPERLMPMTSTGFADSDTPAADFWEIKRDAVVKALEETRYNRTAAATLLGTSFGALRDRIKKLGIEWRAGRSSRYRRTRTM